ncbi:hypothetical protein [Paenibacillus agricola]|uniref:Uncharacterized protein n=1 Tax=Paenibacillus agricola TaxID=2716264 RepID=A0ABX0IXI0_9BACL|nr:hypothetical protein [Paenibacillus agricola]NHN28547.1 hypothetical protein [Paenibacillus agricola]
MGTNIGDNNKIGDNNAIGKNAKVTVKSPPITNPISKKWYEKHPWIYGIVCSIIGSFILMFTFWKHIVTFIENLFN